MLQVDPNTLGTLEIENDVWVPYLNLNDATFVPTRVRLANAEYAFTRSAPVLGYGAVLPAQIRDARAAGQKSVVLEREGRYYLFLSPS